MNDTFYRAFEERYRGSRELIKARLSAYSPFLTPLTAMYPAAAAIDLGCGRGEWLELLTESGFKPFGVDLDAGMLGACYKLGLEVEQGDAIAYLSSLPDESQVVVTAFHVVEHISFEQLRTLASEALRVLKPGGLLIMETPNPENIVVATRNFYLDPTHKRPIPPMLLAFVTEFSGFTRVKTLRLQESKELAATDSISLGNVFSGASPDYAVVGQKNAPEAILALLNEPFNREYGLSLDTLLSRWQNRFDGIEVKVQQAEISAQSAVSRATQAEAGLQAVYGSNSWRITAPLRYVSTTARWLYRGSKAWLTFAPMSRPNRVARQSALHLKLYVAARPRLKALVLRSLAPFPGLRSRLQLLCHPAPPAMQTNNVAKGQETLSPRARQIYADLKTAVGQCQQEQD